MLTFTLTVEDAKALRRAALRTYLTTGGDRAGAASRFGTFRNPSDLAALWEVLVVHETPEYFIAIQEAP